jgi:hypothetical protein
VGPLAARSARLAALTPCLLFAHGAATYWRFIRIAVGEIVQTIVINWDAIGGAWRLPTGGAARRTPR